MKMFRIGNTSLGAWLLCLVTLGGTSPAAAEPPPSAVKLAERVSAARGGANVHSVLAEISRQGHFSVRLDAQLEERVARERTDAVFYGLAPELALRRLLQTESLVFVYAGEQLAEVRAYANRAAESVESRRNQDERRSVSTEATPSTRARDAGRSDQWQLATVALSAEDASERSAALESLAESADDSVASTTAAQVLAHERDEGVLDRALAVLAEQEEMALGPVLDFAAGDGDSALRGRALSILADRGSENPSVRALLTRLARSDRSSDVRETAKALLDELRRHASAR